ncbi:hypothetical protein ABT160_43880 [Streptomyces sp. NPDC001941]|uniref:hypothetical protein n=1 Tax=Streptomyces sp. NPDC001941 TaxID=3154659 RepID=UPI003329A9B0
MPGTAQHSEHAEVPDHEDYVTLRRMLAERLADALAASALSGKKQLADLANVARATLYTAFDPEGPLPSEHTVAALAGPLGLSRAPLLALRRRAVRAMSTGRGPGKPIGQWDPHDLEVHPAGTGTAGPTAGTVARRPLPGYVRRAHDEVLDAAVRDAAAGRSGIVVLVGSSSTGKTRACWNAVQPLAAQGWRLWHPYEPTPAQAALTDLRGIGPRTVVWLNEAQHYLGDRTLGERIAAALRHLLTSPERGPVLVLGTLWHEYARQYTAVPTPGGDDPHAQVRELLAQHTVDVPAAFDRRALDAAVELAEAGDLLLRDALTRARVDGRLTQDLAGAPQLLDRYQRASPVARGLLEAAMDARRLGVGLRLSRAFLTHAARDYLHAYDRDALADEPAWVSAVDAAFSELARPVHGKQAPLRQAAVASPQHPGAPALQVTRPQDLPVRLADYLEHHGRQTRRRGCPPASFWHAAHAHLTAPDDLNALARAAEDRHRMQWAHHLWIRAAEAGDGLGLSRLAMVREDAGDRRGAEDFARRAAGAGISHALRTLARARRRAGDVEAAEALFQQLADVSGADVLIDLARLREEAGDRPGAAEFVQRAATTGSIEALLRLMREREDAGDASGATALAQQAADAGSPSFLIELADRRGDAGDLPGARALLQQAADRGSTQALVRLMREREEAGDPSGAADLARQAARRGRTIGLRHAARMRDEAGDPRGAADFIAEAAAAGDRMAVAEIALLRERAGERQDDEALARQADGDAEVLGYFAVMREEAGDLESAEKLARWATDAGHPSALADLARMRQEAGHPKSAEALAWAAVDAGQPGALADLAHLREESGNPQDIEPLLRAAADAGDTLSLTYGVQFPPQRNWPHGLDPDGTPTPPWEP